MYVWHDILSSFCHKDCYLSLQIGITRPSFATDGNTWLVILDYGSVLIALSLILLIHTLESSPALRLLFLLLGRLVPYYKITSLYSVCVSLSDRAIISFLQLFLLDFISYLHCRPGDTILIAAGGKHLASNIQIKKPLCLVGISSLFITHYTLMCACL